MLRPLYDRVLALAGGNNAAPWLAAVSFAESSVFPIPPDAMLAPMVFARPERAFLYAGICTVASVLGGALGYAIGYFLTGIGLSIVGFFGHAGDVEKFRLWYDHWGVWVILGKGLTPLPYKIVTITSGFLHFNFLMFMAASLVTRGARFFVVAALIKKFGPQVQPVIERHLAVFTVGFLVLVVGGILALKFLA
jgi:membrane protein YqaA with SNARE-associated domain